MACFSALVLVQGLAVAPFVDVARDHHPERFADCPSGSHVEAPIDSHRGLGCLLQFSTTLATSFPIDVAVVRLAPSLAGPALEGPRARLASSDNSRLPPARAPPSDR